ncbi:hypothetical protein OF83DRAFT_373906 [Amylostereum chailletii]|nr:hypothetical protein OF83DRAFT_373906 [Amylostereum chailletii]
MIELMRYQRQQGRYILSLHNAWLLILHLTNMIAAVGMQSVPQNEAQVPGYATSQNQLAQQMNAMRIQEQDIRTSQHRMDMYFNVPGISAEQCALRLQPDNVNKMSMLIERVKQQFLATTEFNEQPSLAIAEHETFEYAETFNKLLVLVEQIESDLAKVICLLEDEQILPKVIEIIGLTRYQRQQASRNRYILTLDKMRQFVQHFTVLMVGAGMQVGPNGVQLSSAPWGSMFPVQSLPPTESMVNVIVTPQNVLTSGQSNKEPAQEGGSSVAAGTNSLSVPSVSWAPPSDEQKLRQEEEEAVAFLDRFAAQFHHDGDDDDDDAKLLEDIDAFLKSESGQDFDADPSAGNARGQS